jgi:hypothetical protein
LDDTPKKITRLRKNLLKSTLLAYCSVAVLLFSGCSQETDGDSGIPIIDEGKIVYKLSYPQFKEDNIFTSMFPKEMEFKFKDNNTRNELKTSMAVFSTSLLTNSKDRKVTHLVRIASKYSGLEMDSLEIMEEYGKKPDGMKITYTDSLKVIAGYQCNHAHVSFGNDTSKYFDVFYTDQIGLDKPNWCTPFYDIKGVLMEAQVTQFNLNMHMIATSVVAEEYPDEDFTITKEYQPITIDEMTDIFQNF